MGSLPSDVLTKAVEMRQVGHTWASIARELNTTTIVLRRQVDPTFRRPDHSHPSKSREERDFEGIKPKPPPLLEEDLLLDRLKAGLGHKYK